jgi:regulator of RNase E activity RraA
VNNPYDYGIPADALVKRYRELYSGAIYDVLDAMGLPNQALAADLKPVLPDMVVAGAAFTMKGIPDSTGKQELRDRRIHMFEDMRSTGAPLIDVRDCSFDTQAAHYGEMNATVGRSCGVIGAVIDGGCRDTAFLLRSQFPIFCRYQSPVEAYRRWSYYEWQQPVALRGALTAIVSVNPGDFMFGDLDGVVVIPRELTVEVLDKTEALVSTENDVRREFESGADPVAIYRRHGRL